MPPEEREEEIESVGTDTEMCSGGIRQQTPIDVAKYCGREDHLTLHILLRIRHPLKR